MLDEYWADRLFEISPVFVALKYDLLPLTGTWAILKRDGLAPGGQMMPDESNAAETSSVSGGVNADTNGGPMAVSGDITGRDKVVSQPVHIERVERYYASNSVTPPPESPVEPPMAKLPPPGDPSPLPRSSGSPFIVGRPLRANEPIFGREDAFRFIAHQLAHYSSINIVGERRLGKSSLINHVLGNQSQYLVSQPDQPPLVLARVDLQANVTTAARFYGMALRELIAHLPASRSAEALALQAMRERLNVNCEATYDEFSRVLHQLRDARGLSVRPALVVDEFESLLDEHIRPGFPFPMFYNGLRSLMTEGALAMVVASRLSLTDHFKALPDSLTSNFPTYFMHFGLQPLTDTAADALLLQPSDHALTVAEAREARQWAKSHPCHLQAAGHAIYEAKAGIHTAMPKQERFLELKSKNCLVNHDAPAPPPPQHVGRLRRVLHAIFIGVPLRLGQLAQKIGLKLDDIASWLIGLAIIIVIVLAVLGLVNALDVVSLVKRALGIQ